jgi:hypothetical protein
MLKYKLVVLTVYMGAGRGVSQVSALPLDRNFAKRK